LLSRKDARVLLGLPRRSILIGAANEDGKHGGTLKVFSLSTAFGPYAMTIWSRVHDRAG
jgi:hypothetical protein